MTNEILTKLEALEKHENYYQQVKGIKYIILGLEYHYSNFIKVVGIKNEFNWFHETVAYLNRLGQVYYFLKSDFMGVNPEDMPIIDRAVQLRMKYGAHRALDNPRSDDRGAMMDISAPNVTLMVLRQGVSDGDGVNLENYTKGFAIAKMKAQGSREQVTFFLENEHDQILIEINQILSAKLDAFVE